MPVDMYLLLDLVRNNDIDAINFVIEKGGTDINA